MKMSQKENHESAFGYVFFLFYLLNLDLIKLELIIHNYHI